MRIGLLPLLIGTLAGGCGQAGTKPVSSGATAAPPAATLHAPRLADWRRIATPQDRYRLREWHTAWMTAFSKARAAGNEKAIAEQGALFDPDHALDEPLPPPGDYRCRMFKVGANGTAAADFTAYPFFACRVAQEGEVRSLTKIGGSQRPVGLLFPDSPARSIFLGTIMLGDEKRLVDYGRDPNRDMIGAVERVGTERWRVILPYPRFESITDVMELVPAG